MDIIYLLDDSVEFTSTFRELVNRNDTFDEVMVFNDPDKFLKYAENRNDVYVLICDFFMPKKTGFEVYTHVRAKHSECLVLMISGNKYENLPINMINDDLLKFIWKGDPYFLNTVIDFAAKYLEKVKRLMRLTQKYNP